MNLVMKVCNFTIRSHFVNDVNADTQYKMIVQFNNVRYFRAAGICIGCVQSNNESSGG